MAIYLGKVWLSQRDRRYPNESVVNVPPPVSLDNRESEDALTALLWAATQPNKQPKDDEKDGENGDK
jgi:hypothetical protein